jgi:hypothetical protein
VTGKNRAIRQLAERLRNYIAVPLALIIGVLLENIISHIFICNHF